MPPLYALISGLAFLVVKCRLNNRRFHRIKLLCTREYFSDYYCHYCHYYRRCYRRYRRFYYYDDDDEVMQAHI